MLQNGHKMCHKVCHKNGDKVCCKLSHKICGKFGTKIFIRIDQMFFTNLVFQMINKNPAYGRHQLSRPMWIVGPNQFWRGCVIY